MSVAGAICASLCVGAHAATPAASPVQCAALMSLQMPGQALQITTAELRPAGPAPRAQGAPPAAGPPVMLPAHCRVEGALDRRTGSDGKPYAIRFAVALPANWNGRFLFQGGGGLNGSVGEPIGAQASGTRSALVKGFAVASTDSGHEGSAFDGSFFADQEAALNFLHQAVARVTVVAKQIVGSYYAQPAHHSYFVGCSTGGREAMMQSQRYPGNFDGIVAGAPAMRTNYSNLALRWITTSLNAVAPANAQGQPQTRMALSDADRKLVIEGVLARCDADDGAKDGWIAAPQSCGFDPSALVCSGAKTDSCLTKAQADAVSRAMSGPRDVTGRQVYPGFYWDTGIATTRGLPGPLAGPMIPVPVPVSGTTMDVAAEAAAAHDANSMTGDTNAWTNLGTFRSRGGKLLFYHGVSDPWFSAQDTVQYFERLARDNGPADVQAWSRLFLVPGMGHCGGGEATLDQFDLLDPLVDWVEAGKAPESVLATGASMPGRARPLCPFPKVTRYRGSGALEDAANFSCQ